MCRYRQAGMFAARQDRQEEPAWGGFTTEERTATNDHVQEVGPAVTEVDAPALRAVS